MKNLKLLFVTLLLVTCLIFACSKNKNDEITKDQILGSWLIDKGAESSTYGKRLRLLANDSIYYDDCCGQSGIYSIVSNKVNIVSGFQSPCPAICLSPLIGDKGYYFKISRTKLNAYDGNGKMIFTASKN